MLFGKLKKAILVKKKTYQTYLSVS